MRRSDACQTKPARVSVILTLIAHAATSAVRQDAFALDEPLDAAGHAKAAAMRRVVRRVDRAWTSPALRARQTAAAMGLEATIDPALREVDYGSWAGRTLDAVAMADPAGVARWLSDAAAAPHGGESLEALLERVRTWLVGAQAWEGRVLCVTHASVMRAAVVGALDAPTAAFWRIDVAPLARVRLRGSAGRWTLLAVG
jgi:broad specificity phosphatase PhoE